MSVTNNNTFSEEVYSLLDKYDLFVKDENEFRIEFVCGNNTYRLFKKHPSWSDEPLFKLLRNQIRCGKGLKRDELQPLFERELVIE